MAVCLAAGAPALNAQNSGPSQQNQPNSAQNPSSPPPQADGNPFPGDESTVPVMPSRSTPDFSSDIEGLGRAAAPPRDTDPVASPEDVAPGGSQSSSGFSSSQSGLDNLTTAPPPEPGQKHREDGGSQIDMPHESPKEDMNVGNYYLDNQDWRGALSRFESALVLAPDNPDVYWGLAESQRHLGQYAAARQNYLKVMEYDPGSHHAKEAKKRLRDPQIANAKPASTEK
ncbi:MAG: tetratricopeptide repeat protein [Acidobacteriota bacterium]